MRNRLLAVPFAVTALMVAPAACTEPADVRDVPGTSSVPGRVSVQDADWMAQAHRVNLTEIEAGLLARHRSADAQVRAAGAMLVRDHRRLDAKLEATAAGLGVELPHAPSARQRMELDALKDREERLFNLAWMTAMIAGHEEAIEATQREIARGSSPQVIALARERLPVLREHRAELYELKGMEGT
ncbi:DUF4142 domain-containing protein [Actinomadura sediminis]|uniref:DUF4142 domain-containing protein n=2 Tax=Actinomadura sediminis TaxID=1038904 RepID=A0ABW3EIL5_9ACTN